MAEMDARETALRGIEDRLVELALARADVETVTVLVGDTLSGIGIAVDEIRVGARTLHPEIDAIAVTWIADRGSDSDVFRHSEDTREVWLRSPLFHMLTSGALRMHRPLHAADCPIDFPVFAEMREAGFTDYLAHLVPVGAPGRARPEGFIIRWLSRRPDGFGPQDLTDLDRVVRRVVAACEPGRERMIARDLLGAYLGARSGAAVLNGSVQPGHTQSLEAVILVADLAGFTAASDTMPGTQLVDFLDRHFDAMVPPVEAEGGEILAFLGDGFLAAFDAAGDPGGDRGLPAAGAGRPAGRHRAAPGHGALRQCRRRRASGLHRHRPGGQPRQPDRSAVQCPGLSDRDLGRRGGPAPTGLGAGLRRASGPWHGRACSIVFLEIGGRTIKNPVMDDIDRKIVGLVQASGRSTNAEIAGACGLSVSAANERLKRLQERGVITGWSARIDPDAVDLGLLAFLFVEVERPEHNAQFLAAAAQMPEVLELHHVTGEWSYLLKVRARDTKALETLITDRLKALPGVARSRTHIALSSAKENGPLPVGGPGDG
jgi:DNA-binding Lrp family transcriptional regulator/class 3 adenylate cyclase